MKHVYVAAALRSAVVPRNGAFRKLEAWDIAGSLIKRLAEDAGLDASFETEVVLGNALYGGGNPARMAALAAGLPASVSAMTIDTQCCSGLDAIALGAARIATGQVECVIAGGLESYSRAPLRYRRPKEIGETAIPYDRPPFAPWPNRDPDLIASAAKLACELKITRADQEAFARRSHATALARHGEQEIVAIAGVEGDAFPRKLSPNLCAKLPALAGDAPYDLTAATVSVEADAAAVILLASERALKRLGNRLTPIRVAETISRGFDPSQPALAAIHTARRLLMRNQLAANSISVVEIMEAFAVQAMAFVDAFKFDPAIVNCGGGALSRGHPIGASGAILAVRLFHELQDQRPGATGLAAIAAAGGLGSALLLQA